MSQAALGPNPVRGAIVPRPELFERLAGAGRVTVVSAPAGSGKTTLLRSWIAEAGIEDRVGWVAVQRGERDPQRFWISVLDALRGTSAGSAAVRAVTPAPGLDGGAIVERLLEDIASLEEPLWLVIDDLHELRCDEALRELGLLMLRAPELRFVVSTRGDARLGLHRLRLEGELTEVRAEDLRFSLDEARALFQGCAVAVSETALARLHERTEGWGAGLRLAVLSICANPDPERFAAEFGGGERTVTEYLLAEVLERQPEDSRRLLLRTSILERVNGPLADLLTGGSGGERILLKLEAAGAFVTSLDARRIWFRYHQMFAEMLQLELRRTAPGELSALHDAAAGWFAQHGYPVEAIGHAQAARHWTLAAQLLADHWIPLRAAGQLATAEAMLGGFPDDVVAADAELSTLVAAELLIRGSLAEAKRQVARATRLSASVPAERRLRFEALLTIQRLRLASRRTDLAAVRGETDRLMAIVEVSDAEPFELGAELHAVALAYLGIAEFWTGRLTDAERHLEQARELANRTDRPYIEVCCLAYWALPLLFRSFALARKESLRAIGRACDHGWGDAPEVAIAYAVLGAILVWQGQLDEAQRWLDEAQRTTLPPEVEPAAGLLLRVARGTLELGRGRDQDALTALTAAIHLDELLATPHPLAGLARGLMLQAMLRLGDVQRVEQALAELDSELRGDSELRKATAVLRLAQDDPEGATAVLAPVIDGSVPVLHPTMRAEAFLLEAIARDALGDPGAADRALESALDVAEPDGVMWPFLLHPTEELLERHSRHRTTHTSMVSEIRSLLAGRRPASRLRFSHAEPVTEPLSESETRVLRYLPTNLSAPEIAGELFVSVSTVKTHIQHVYGKLGVHTRAEAVERARALGLLAPASLRCGAPRCATLPR